MNIRPSFSVLASLFFIGAALSFTSVNAQYVVNGNATQLSCNCYRLTEAINNQGGSVWNSNQISLVNPFDFTFDVYLGDIPGGADGIAFVLQPVSTAEGSLGGGVGYAGIVPSVAIEVDTYKNNWDPVEDHMGIQANGDNDHTTANNLAGPNIALVSGLNIEDGQVHLMRVTWNPTTLTLDAYMDGSLRVSYTGDIVTNFLSGDPLVFWGFTGSTGGLNNVHEFCLSIIPGLEASTDNICEGEEVIFDDNSYSALGEVVSWDWDFGNGMNSTDQFPGAIQFSTAGTYTVVQTIVDAAGCDASDSLEITVNPNPEADFTATEVCEGEETEFNDMSVVSSGTVVDWNWDFGNGEVGGGSGPATTYATAGTYSVMLDVTTNFGCVDTIETDVTVFSNPTAAATHVATSLDVDFTTTLLTGEEAVWLINDSTISGLDMVHYTFPDSGWYEITLTITNANGCTDVFQYSIYVEGIPEYIMPNVFTPNGDDYNERFQPYTYAMVEAVMRVYNRWGRPVFKYEGAIPPVDVWGWDGTVNGGAKAAEGTYYYILDLKGTDGNNFLNHGTVTLVR